MLKIGDFSKLSQVPVKTLRYYDEIGLFSPARVDQFTGYRQYTFDQLSRLNRILALKDLGFSLEQITRLLDGGLSPAQMREILVMKQNELQLQLRQEQERLARVEWRLRQIELEGVVSPYEIVLKQTEPMLVASVRETIANYASVGPLFGELFGYLAQSGERIGVCAAIWHEEEYKEQHVDAEALVAVSRRLPGAGRVQVYELPRMTVAATIHRGSYRDLHLAYAAVTEWIGANGYTIAGPSREFYLQFSDDGNRDDESNITEIQFPVEKEK